MLPSDGGVQWRILTDNRQAMKIEKVSWTTAAVAAAPETGISCKRTSTVVAAAAAPSGMKQQQQQQQSAAAICSKQQEEET
jgi:hypothetical protein